MAGVNMTGLKPVKFAFGQIHITGGHGAKPIPVTSKIVSDPFGSKNTCVKMASTEVWLVFAATGQHTYSAASWGRTSLLEDLRDKVQKHCDGDRSSSSSVATASEDYDPMMEVEQEQWGNDISPPKTISQGQQRALIQESLKGFNRDRGHACPLPRG